jgi:hypothetical protein
MDTIMNEFDLLVSMSLYLLLALYHATVKIIDYNERIEYYDAVEVIDRTVRFKAKYSQFYYAADIVPYRDYVKRSIAQLDNEYLDQWIKWGGLDRLDNNEDPLLSLPKPYTLYL